MTTQTSEPSLFTMSVNVPLNAVDSILIPASKDIDDTEVFFDYCPDCGGAMEILQIDEFGVRHAVVLDAASVDILLPQILRWRLGNALR